MATELFVHILSVFHSTINAVSLPVISLSPMETSSLFVGQLLGAFVTSRFIRCKYNVLFILFIGNCIGIYLYFFNAPLILSRFIIGLFNTDPLLLSDAQYAWYVGFFIAVWMRTDDQIILVSIFLQSCVVFCFALFFDSKNVFIVENVKDQKKRIYKNASDLAYVLWGILLYGVSDGFFHIGFNYVLYNFYQVQLIDISLFYIMINTFLLFTPNVIPMNHLLLTTFFYATTTLSLIFCNRYPHVFILNYLLLKYVEEYSRLRLHDTDTILHPINRKLIYSFVHSFGKLVSSCVLYEKKEPIYNIHTIIWFFTLLTFIHGWFTLAAETKRSEEDESDKRDDRSVEI